MSEKRVTRIGHRIAPSGKSAFVSLAQAAEALGVAVATFRESYQRLFTDTRPPHLSRRGTPIRIARVELDLVVNDGWAALADYRCRLGKD